MVNCYQKFVIWKLEIGNWRTENEDLPVGRLMVRMSFGMVVPGLSNS